MQNNFNPNALPRQGFNPANINPNRPAQQGPALVPMRAPYENEPPLIDPGRRAPYPDDPPYNFAPPLRVPSPMAIPRYPQPLQPARVNNFVNYNGNGGAPPLHAGRPMQNNVPIPNRQAPYFLDPPYDNNNDGYAPPRPPVQMAGYAQPLQRAGVNGPGLYNGYGGVRPQPPAAAPTPAVDLSQYTSIVAQPMLFANFRTIDKKKADFHAFDTRDNNNYLQFHLKKKDGETYWKVIILRPPQVTDVAGHPATGTGFRLSQKGDLYKRRDIERKVKYYELHYKPDEATCFFKRPPADISASS